MVSLEFIPLSFELVDCRTHPSVLFFGALSADLIEFSLSMKVNPFVFCFWLRAHPETVETLLSTGKLLHVDIRKARCVGVQINCNSLTILLEIWTSNACSWISQWDVRCFETIVVRVAFVEAATPIVVIVVIAYQVILLAQTSSHAIATF